MNNSYFYRSDETGREILKNKPRLRENINLETLLKLDQNTFGFVFYK